jgi:hypothetical protein
LDESSDLFFSGLIELDETDDRGIQIFNPTRASIDVTQYNLNIGRDVSSLENFVTNTRYSIPLCAKYTDSDCGSESCTCSNTQLPSGKSMIIAKKWGEGNVDLRNMVKEDTVYGFAYSKLQYATGDDWLVLTKGPTVIDIIGDLAKGEVEEKGPGADGVEVSTNKMSIKRTANAVPTGKNGQGNIRPKKGRSEL